MKGSLTKMSNSVVSNDWGSVDSVGHNRGVVGHSVVGNNGGGVVHGVGHGVGNHGGVHGVGENRGVVSHDGGGVDCVGEDGGGVGDHGGSVVRGEVTSGDDGAAVADGGVVGNVGGGGGSSQAQQSSADESLELEDFYKLPHIKSTNIDTGFNHLFALPSFLFCRSLPTDGWQAGTMLYIVVTVAPLSTSLHGSPTPPTDTH